MSVYSLHMQFLNHSSSVGYEYVSFVTTAPMLSEINLTGTNVLLLIATINRQLYITEKPTRLFK